MKLEVKTTQSNQEAIPEIGKVAKSLYYLIIGEGEDKVIINVGEKTYNSVTKLKK